MKITEILGVVALVLIFLRIHYLLRQPGQSARRASGAGGNMREVPKYRVGSAGPALITVEQLTADASAVWARFVVTNMPIQGIPITRGEGGPLSIRLSKGMDCTATVGAPHAYLLKDEKGFFLQVPEGAPHRLRSGEKLTDEVAIRDNMIVYLGKQPIRFRLFSENRKTSRG